jgi:hypothetical protein
MRSVLTTNMQLLIFSLLTLGCNHKQAETVVVDVNRQTPISPYIYGANSPDWAHMSVPFTLARQGGNRMTAYNWETNASNAGSDYHNQNDGYMGSSDESGWTVRTFLEATQSHGAAAILTVPTAGYVSADKKGDGDVINTPNYLETRFLKSLARKPGKFVYPPDVTDRAVYQDEFVVWIEKIKSSNTPVWFMLDNEPDLWGSTHSRIWLKNPTYAQIIANNIEFAKAIKDVAPKALIFGPANYGWAGFHSFQGAPDAQGRDFLDTYLSALSAAGQDRRLLDVLDVHWYPEAKGDNVRVTENSDSPGVSAARIQAPRSLWDPTYVENSWIEQATNNKPIALIPTIQNQIAEHYPGTKFSISEYNYGGNKSISGAIAQADVLGIFGRYGLFAACNWGISPNDTAEIAGFNSFLNFDGKGAKFGDLGLAVRGETPAETSVYAALDSHNQHRLTVVAINKTNLARPMRILLKGFSPVSANGYTVSASSLTEPTPLQVSQQGNSEIIVAPPFSVTTIEAHS